MAATAACLPAVDDPAVHLRQKTGHYYIWITKRLKSIDANEYAKKHSIQYKGTTLANWHLATISDESENDYVFDVVLEGGMSDTTHDTSFLGAINKDGSVTNFTWVTGEPFTYKNFSPGQPDLAREKVLEMGGGWGRQWNDQDGPDSDGEQEHPFILEHEPVRITTN